MRASLANSDLGVAATPLLDRVAGSDTFEALSAIRLPVAIVGSDAGPRAIVLGDAGLSSPEIAGHDLLAVLPPVYPEWLGDRGFTAAHGVRFPYVIGEMARGIATPRMTIEGVRAGVMAFYGSAGLDLDTIEAGVREIQGALGQDAGGWGANLIHNLHNEAVEVATVDLFHRLGVRYVSASAFMRLTPAIVLYAVKGLRRGADGQIVRAGHIFAKVSRDEVARHFLSPAPEAMLHALVAEGRITARRSPARRRYTDRGGHHRRGGLRWPHRQPRADRAAPTPDQPA